MIKSHGDDCLRAVGIPHYRFHDAEPPAERAALLHLPLEFQALAYFQVRHIVQNTIAIHFRGKRRHELRFQFFAHRGPAESQPVAFMVWDLLGKHLAGAHVAGNVAVDVGIPTDLGQHAGHGKSELLLSIVHLQQCFVLSRAGVAVHRLPIRFHVSYFRHMALGFMECRPTLSIHAFPLLGTEKLAVLEDGFRRKLAQVGHIERLLQKVDHIVQHRQGQNHM
mmetsp:Transcript_6058/g.8459  ORF Transcript_6058/g.8459 Transcript_6058/m.8459 type:complete len:222 (-) Transcript_6058:37-702(-)